MSLKQLLIRDVPEDLHGWIEDQRMERRLTQQSFLMGIIEEAYRTQQLLLFDETPQSAKPQKGKLPFTFVDLFAGIGGFRIGLQRVGGKCVFSSEWDPHSQRTYREWFGEIPHGDITKIPPKQIPDHDLLAAGFPCQPFSIAGVSKKLSLGRDHGFKDLTQGTLFFHLATIAEIKRPPILFLENVKNLISHDKRRTWKVIVKTLEDLDYKVFFEIIDAKAYVPQHRERIYIVCFDVHVFGKDIQFQFPDLSLKESPRLKDILQDRVDPKYTLSDHLWNYLQDYARKHKEKGNGFGFGLADFNGITRTLSQRYYKDGSEILIAQKNKNPRRLTPREAARLMGYDDDLPIVVSDTQAYRQFGNSVCPKVVEDIANKIVETMAWTLTLQNGGCLLKSANERPKGVRKD